jgi:hypothetical protein
MLPYTLNGTSIARPARALEKPPVINVEATNRLRNRSIIRVIHVKVTVLYLIHCVIIAQEEDASYADIVAKAIVLTVQEKAAGMKL